MVFPKTVSRRFEYGTYSHYTPVETLATVFHAENHVISPGFKYKIVFNYGLKPRVFWAPTGTRLWARCHFTGTKKLSNFRAQPPSHIP